uniref:AvrL2-A n=1 Tax=Melampsora lini TaxID=5261 RepID=A0A1B2CW13_MELLI|nr:AvrL2-A [Melampsora lini]
MGKGNNIQTPCFRASQLRSFCLIAFLLCQSLQSIVSLPALSSKVELSAQKIKVQARVNQFVRENNRPPRRSELDVILSQENLKLKAGYLPPQSSTSHEDNWETLDKEIEEYRNGKSFKVEDLPKEEELVKYKADEVPPPRYDDYFIKTPK